MKENSDSECTMNCSCPSCISIAGGTCEICWEKPFDYVDEDGQKWNICKECALIEHLCKEYGRGVIEVPGAYEMSLLHIGGVDIKYWEP